MNFWKGRNYLSFEIGVVGFICFIVACDSNPCRNEVLQMVASPNEGRKAVIFQRDCGATTGFSTQLSILRANDEFPKEPGNTFIADTDGGQAPAGKGGGPEVKVQWVGETELIVMHDKRARVFLSEPTIDGVKLRYERY